MHTFESIAARMRETLKLGYVDYAQQYLDHYSDGERNPDRLAWFLASNAEYNQRYDLLELSLLELLPMLDKPFNILLSLLDSNLGWDDNTEELFILYTKSLSMPDRQLLFKMTRSEYPKLLP
jgi:hypothetical protein